MKISKKIILIFLFTGLFINKQGFSQELAGYTAKSLIKTQIGTSPGDLGVKIIEGEVTSPQKMVVDNNGNIYIFDIANNRISKFDNTGKYVQSIKVDSYRLEQKNDILPKMHKADRDIAIDSKNNLYVYNSEKLIIKKYNSSGDFIQEYKIPETEEIKNTYIDGEYGPSYYNLNIKIDHSDNLIIKLNVIREKDKMYVLEGENLYEYTHWETGKSYFKVEVENAMAYLRIINGKGDKRNIKIKNENDIYQVNFKQIDVNNNIYLAVITKKESGYKWYLYVYDFNGQELNRIELQYPIDFIDTMGNLYSFLSRGDPYLDEKNIKFEVIKWERSKK